MYLENRSASSEDIEYTMMHVPTFFLDSEILPELFGRNQLLYIKEILFY